jgi:hypothetical protein
MSAMLIDVTGAVLIALGILMGYQARRRLFDRSNVYGVERSATYWRRLKARTLDTALRTASLTTVAVGLVILAYVHLDTWGAFIIAPLAILVLFLLLGF